MTMGGDGRNQGQATMGRDQGKEGQEEGRQQPVTMKMPVGFRFAPSDEQLVSCYLKDKLRGVSPSMEGLVVDFDIYGCDPWDLPRELFKYPGAELERGMMYFFTPTHAPANTAGQGLRCGRTAGCGVWHGNGKDILIRGLDASTGRPAVVGHKTSFKFVKFNNKGGAGARIKTDWLMQEYRLHPHPTVGAGGDSHSDRRGSVLSKIYYKGGGSGKPGDDGDGDWPQPQHQPQPPPKRKRAVVEPPEQAISSADAALPFSPDTDTPLTICWAGHPESDLILIDDDEDRMPAAKRMRVAQPPPEAAEEQPDPLDAAFALDLEGMLDTDDLPVPPPPPPDSHQLMTGSADASAAADQSCCQPSMPSSSDDPFAMLSADALPSLPPLPSPPPSTAGVDPPHYWADFADPWSFGPEGTPLGSIPLLDDPLQFWPDLPSPPPLPISSAPDTSAPGDQSGCPPSMSPDVASALQPQGMPNTHALPSLPPLPSPPQSMTGVDPRPWWADFAEDGSFGPDGTPLGSIPLLDDTSFVSPSFQGDESSFWQDPSFF